MVNVGIVNISDQCHNVCNKAWVPTDCLLKAHSLADRENL